MISGFTPRNRARVLVVLVTMVLGATFSLQAQYNPPPGAVTAPALRSPDLTGHRGSVTSLDAPHGALMNPAAPARAERPVIDGSYVGITGFGVDGQGWDGHGASLGATFPTRYGVFTGGLHALSSTVEDFRLGTGLGINASYAREVWDDLDVGAGVNLDAGGDGDRLVAGATLDLGFMYRPDSLFGIDGGRLGVAMRGMGYGYRPIEGGNAVPPVFTPAVGIAAPVLDGENIDLELSYELSAPSFQDGRADFGARLSLFDRVNVNAGWGASARELFDSDFEQGSLLPSFGLSVRFGADLSGRTGESSTIAEQGWDRSDVEVRSGARPLYGPAWAISSGFNAALGIVDDTPPDVSIDYAETKYVGPNNSGVNDDLTLPIAISSENRLAGWELLILDSDDTVVRTIENRLEPPTERNVETFFSQLTRVDRGIDVPESIRWNGRSDDGAVVEDGEYSFVLEAWDERGNRGSSQQHTVVIDATPPSAQVSTPFGAERRFSPNDDGSRDTFPISQDGSSEDRWEGEIRNADGETVRTYEWTDGSPDSFEWDGRDDDGEFADDGVYSYHLSATDRAGNPFSTQLANIIKDTEPTPVDISIGSRFLAPTGNDVNETIMLRTEVPVTENIVSWDLEVIDADNSVVFSRSGTTGTPPSEYEFRGRGADGSVLPEGDYRARITVLYRNGNEPVAVSAPFTVDVTPPTAGVSREFPVFAPTGDGNRDTMILYNEAAGGHRWTARILDNEEHVVFSRDWSRTVPTRWEWDGRRDDGSLAPDGEYSYQLEGVDEAGNRTTSEPVSFRMNTEDTDVFITAEFDAFSPNDNGRRDSIRFFPETRAETGVEGFRLEIIDESDAVVRSWSDTAIPSEIVWDGYDREGRRMPDGNYRSRLEVDYETGVTESATTASFVLDTEPPEATVTIDEKLFSPDGEDGRQQISVSQEGSGAQTWHGRFVDADGDTVRAFEWDDTPESFEWDGRDDAGNRLSDGRYTYELSAEDQAGNATRIELSDIVIDTRTPRVFVTAGASGFSPTGTGMHEDIDFEVLISPADGADRFSLDIQAEDGSVVRTFERESIESEQRVLWDGTDDDGELVTEGEYRAQLTVEFAKGNRPTTRSTSFEVVTEAPRVSVELDHEPFTPDGISGPEELEFMIDVETLADIAEWELEILDRNERFFNEFYGTGRPASTIRWDGRASDGEQVLSAEDYPYIMRVTDVYGNETVVEGSVPIGILLVRDGDRYKVQIPSITFEPNSPNLVVDEDDPRGVQNNAVLERLVEIFGRYQQYGIVIEGHAVNLTGTDREEEEILEPLSRARAESVKEALVERGLSDRRIDVVGRGGLDPMVPHDDLDERWRNRRVDFILER